MFWVWTDGVAPHQFRWRDICYVIHALADDDGDEVAWFFCSFKPMEFQYEPEDIEELARILTRVDEDDLRRQVAENEELDEWEDGLDAVCVVRELKNFVKAAIDNNQALFIERQGPYR